MKRQQRNRVKIYDSNCQGFHVRGTAQQIEQKYRTMAYETKDRTEIEGFLQHAEHYNRIGAENNGTRF